MVTRQLLVESKTGTVRRPKVDVLPLCCATSQGNIIAVIYGHCTIFAKLTGEDLSRYLNETESVEKPSDNARSVI